MVRISPQCRDVTAAESLLSNINVSRAHASMPDVRTRIREDKTGGTVQYRADCQLKLGELVMQFMRLISAGSGKWLDVELGTTVSPLSDKYRVRVDHRRLSSKPTLLA